jgi:signal transduction histidine kinase
MKWTAWEVIRLLLVVALSMAAGMALLLGFGWSVLWLDGVVKNWHGNIVWKVFSTAAGIVLIVVILWDRIVTATLLFKGYSAKQVLFGDAPHRLMMVEEKWEERKRKWRRFFGRQ